MFVGKTQVERCLHPLFLVMKNYSVCCQNEMAKTPANHPKKTKTSSNVHVLPGTTVPNCCQLLPSLPWVAGQVLHLPSPGLGSGSWMNWQMPRWLAGSPCTVGCEHVTRVPYIEFTDMNILYTSISHMIFLINAYVHTYIYI